MVFILRYEIFLQYNCFGVGGANLAKIQIHKRSKKKKKENHAGFNFFLPSKLKKD